MSYTVREYDPVKRRTITRTVTDDEVRIETQTDVEPVLNQSKALFAMADVRPGLNAFRGDGAGAMGHLVAQIPPAVYYALPAHIRDDDKAFAAWLNDPDQRAFRVLPGRV